jgi:2-dehydro-3-deoxygluconokinase
MGRTWCGAVGHADLVPMVAAAGAAGLEIRRELFDGPQDLPALRALLEQHKLFSVYSAPLELFGADGRFDREQIGQAMNEAEEIGARFLKVSLGHFSAGSDLQSLLRFLSHSPSKSCWKTTRPRRADGWSPSSASWRCAPAMAMPSA